MTIARSVYVGRQVDGRRREGGGHVDRPFLRPSRQGARRRSLTGQLVFIAVFSLPRGGFAMRVFLVNPSHVSFGTAVITPRWLYVLAAATPSHWGDPVLRDETLDPFDADEIAAGRRRRHRHSYRATRCAATRSDSSRASAARTWSSAASTRRSIPKRCSSSAARTRSSAATATASGRRCSTTASPARRSAIYEAGQIGGDRFRVARWDLLPEGRYMWASVQTVRGCPKHCSFCSVWRTDGQAPRQAGVDAVIREVVELRRRGFRFIALADDNFYPVSLGDLAQARRRSDPSRLHELEAIRAERFALMERLARLPDDMVFFTQITMEAAEDPDFLDAMRRARIRGALVGVESVTPEGLKDVYKGFNLSGDALVERLQTFRAHGIHVLGSFIFGLPSDRADTFEATADLADRAGVTFAQFVMLTPFPGTVDFERWEREIGGTARKIGGVPITRHWLIPQERRPKVYVPHPVMTARGNPPAHAGGVGSLLRAAAHLGALAHRALAQGSAGLRAHLEALSPDVREHRHCHRLGASRAVGADRADDRAPLPAPVRCRADARPGNSRRVTEAVHAYHCARSRTRSWLVGTDRDRRCRRYAGCPDPRGEGAALRHVRRRAAAPVLDHARGHRPCAHRLAERQRRRARLRTARRHGAGARAGRHQPVGLRLRRSVRQRRVRPCTDDRLAADLVQRRGRGGDRSGEETSRLSVRASSPAPRGGACRAFARPKG